MNVVGVDGCAAGWAAVGRTESGLCLRVFHHIAELVTEYAEAERIFIDIPIGLPWAVVPSRPCDLLARKALGKPRDSSVFPAPCREALSTSGVAEAREINLVVLGKSLSVQAWNLIPKIAEVDALLQSSPSHHTQIREIHPEVCFWGLARGTPMASAKGTRKGATERLHLLEQYESGITDLIRSFRSKRTPGVKADDVLDAAAAFLTAEARVGALESLGGNPSHDLTGLPMEMMYLRV